MEDEVTILICLTVEGDPQRYIVPGSIEHHCNDCDTKVWVAPSGQKLMRENALAIIVCMKCFLGRIVRAPGTDEIIMLPEAAKEVKAWRSRN